MAGTIEELRLKIRSFVDERDWDQFHTPKNLVMSLAVEAAELMEPFQWLTEQQSLSLNPSQMAQVSDEIGDVFYYLLRLCDKLSIDPVQAASNKLHKSAEKYPAARVRGKSLKYNEYP